MTNTFNKWYFGNPLYDWANNGVNHKTYSLSDLPASYFFLLFGMIIFSIIAIGLFAKYNKKYRLIKIYRLDEELEERHQYIKKHDLVVRLLAIIIGLFMMFLPLLDSLHDIVSNGNKIAKSEVLARIWSYIIGAQWYHLCMLSSFFIGLALVLKKYRFILIAWPLALIGAMLTLINGDDIIKLLNYTAPNFWRFIFQNILILFMPLFFSISLGIKYNKRIFLQTLLYSFLMGFVGYILHWIVILSGTNSISDWSDMIKVGKILGYNETWVLDHYHFYFWLLYIGFGLCIALPIIYIYNFFFNKALFRNEQWHIRWVMAFKIILKKRHLPIIKEVKFV